MANLDSILKSSTITLPRNVCVVKAVVFPEVMYGCESWTIKKGEHWRIDAFKQVLEKTLDSPSDSKEVKPVNPKGNQFWIFTGGTDAEDEAPILWSPSVKSWLIGKDPDAGKDWRQEEKGITEDEMTGWHHQLDGHEVGQAPGTGDGQGSLACCSLWGCKESDTTERLNWTSSKKQASFNFMTAVIICSDFGAQENKICHGFHSLPIYLPWSDGTRCPLSQLFHSPLSPSSRGSLVPLHFLP